MKNYWTAVLLPLLMLILTMSGGCKIVNDDAAGPADPRAAERVDPDALPLNVSAAVKGLMPGGKITRAEKQLRSNRTVYRFEITEAGRDHEVIVAPNGQVLSQRTLTQP